MFLSEKHALLSSNLVPERWKSHFRALKLQKGDQWPLVDTVGYTVQTCGLLQFLLKPLNVNKWEVVTLLSFLHAVTTTKKREREKKKEDIMLS